MESRITKLASMRVDYGQLVSELSLRNEELRDANKEFAKAESILRASEKVDLISPLDGAQAGIRPLGPGNKAIFLGACLAGIMIGLGMVMMVTPAPNLMPTHSSRPGGGPGGHSGYAPPANPGPQTVQANQAQAMAAAQAAAARSPGFVIPDLGSGTSSHTPVN